MLPAQEDDGPPISITSPDTAQTFAYATIKNHTLVWRKNDRMLVAFVTFTDAQQNMGEPSDDTQEFRLPGVTFDETKKTFFATSAKGEVIPVAHLKKALFFTTIVVTPNAGVRIIHPKGKVTVILEAISLNDPALHESPDSDPDGTHKVDINKIFQ